MIKGSETPRIYTPPLRELTPDTSIGFEIIDFAENVLKLKYWAAGLSNFIQLNNNYSFLLLLLFRIVYVSIVVIIVCLVKAGKQKYSLKH